MSLALIIVVLTTEAAWERVLVTFYTSNALIIRYQRIGFYQIIDDDGGCIRGLGRYDDQAFFALVSFFASIAMPLLACVTRLLKWHPSYLTQMMRSRKLPIFRSSDLPTSVILLYTKTIEQCAIKT